MNSKRFSLNVSDVRKIFYGTLIAGGAAMTTYLLQAVSGFDYGIYTPFVVSIFAILINASKVIEIGNYKKILWGAMIAIGGAVLTYASQYIAGADFGIYTPIITAAASIAINIIRKYLAGLPQ